MSCSHSTHTMHVCVCRLFLLVLFRVFHSVSIARIKVVAVAATAAAVTAALPIKIDKNHGRPTHKRIYTHFKSGQIYLSIIIITHSTLVISNVRTLARMKTYKRTNTLRPR